MPGPALLSENILALPTTERWTPLSPAYRNYTPEKDAKRNAVNDWIRNTNVFDAILDFDLALRDPYQPDRLLPFYDSGDHIHPGMRDTRRWPA